MSYSQKLARKLLAPVITHGDVLAVVLIDLYRGIVVFSDIGGDFPLDDPDVAAQLIHSYAVHEALNLRFEMRACMTYLLIHYDEYDKRPDKRYNFYLIIQASESRHWLLIVQHYSRSRISPVMQEMTQALQQCDEQLIEEA